MANREAKNITYKDFLTSESGDLENVVSHKSEIPEFQRNYVWKKSQIKELIDAIDENDEGYYLGNIVLVKKSDGNGLGKIVDGQQRLVTLSLVLFVLLDYVDTESKTRIEEQLWHDRGNTTFRIKFDKSILGDIYGAILSKDEINEDNLNKSQLILHKAYKSIQSIIQSDILDKDTFLKKVLNLEFVVIRTFTENEAYLLFEGLNSTGLSLSAVELTKNAILGKIKELNNTELNNTNIRLENALSDWNEIEGRFENSNLSWFLKMLRSQWFYIDGYVTNSNLFKKIKEEKIQNASIYGLLDYLESIKLDSKRYLKLRETKHLEMQDFDINMNGFDEIKRILFETSKLKIDQIYSVYLALWKYGSEVDVHYIQDGRRFTEHVNKIWAFSFLIKFSDISPSKYERVFAGLAEDIKNKNYNEFKIRMKEFFSELHLIVSSMNKDEFEKRVSEKISVDSYDSSFVKFIIKEYLEAGLDNEDTLEHIIPQDYSLWEKVTDSLNLNYIENIGNITLLSATANEGAGNKIFNEKIEVYNQSGFDANKTLFDNYGSGFNSDNPIENGVKNRGEDIGGALYDKYLSLLSGN